MKYFNDFLKLLKEDYNTTNFYLFDEGKNGVRRRICSVETVMKLNLKQYLKSFTKERAVESFGISEFDFSSHGLRFAAIRLSRGFLMMVWPGMFLHQGMMTIADEIKNEKGFPSLNFKKLLNEAYRQTNDPLPTVVLFPGIWADNMVYSNLPKPAMFRQKPFYQEIGISISEIQH